MLETKVFFQPSPFAALGRVWFRWRGVSPVPFFLLMMLFPREARYPFWVNALFLAAAFAAEGARIWTVGYMGSATRTRGEGVPELVHAGPLRHVRNPLYLANMVQYTMVGLLFGHPKLTVLLLAYTAFQYHCIVAFEEGRLNALFGAPYSVYQSQVPRWAIAWRPRCRASGHTFDLQRALRSERGTFYVMAALIFAVAFKGL